MRVLLAALFVIGVVFGLAGVMSSFYGEDSWPWWSGLAAIGALCLSTALALVLFNRRGSRLSLLPMSREQRAVSVDVNDDAPQLRHGSDWADHEDCLVGNEAGLKRLREACDVALRNGQYFGSDLGEFVGIKRLESSWFRNPRDSQPTRIANVVFSFVLLFLVMLLGIGVVTVIRWAVPG